MKITNQEQLNALIATADESNTIVLQENLEITVDCVIPCNIKAYNIDAWDIKAHNIEAEDIKAFDIKANDINANDINASNIKAFDIKANDIDAYNIDAGNINACNINAGDINACNITYYTFCIARGSFACKSVKGSRENSLHTCLDQEIKYIDAVKLPEQKPAIEKSSEVDKVQEAKRELRYLLEINPCYDYYYDHGRTLEEIRKSAQNLINALDSQKMAGSKSAPLADVPSQSGETSAGGKTKSIWKPMSELPRSRCNVYIRLKNGGGEIQLAHYRQLTGFNIITVNGLEGVVFDNSLDDCVEEYCTLTDFNKQVQDNTDRLDKLENLNK